MEPVNVHVGAYIHDSTAFGENRVAVTAGCSTVVLPFALNPSYARHHSYRPPNVSLSDGVSHHPSCAQSALVRVLPSPSVATLVNKSPERQSGVLYVGLFRR